jgi:hypothetical protein
MKSFNHRSKDAKRPVPRTTSLLQIQVANIHETESCAPQLNKLLSAKKEFLKNLVSRTEVQQVSQAKILRARRRGVGRVGSGRRWLDSEKTSSLVAGCKSCSRSSSGRVVETGSGRRVRARHPGSEGEDVVARRRMHIRCRATRR